jgi:hypothetical protein
VLAGHEVFAEQDRWNLDDDQRRVEQAVRYLVKIFIDNAALLRAVALISGAHPGPDPAAVRRSNRRSCLSLSRAVQVSSPVGSEPGA